jgi:16S rRNA (guanine966-N2)-methyltransferase
MPRIIGGVAGGRRLATPPGAGTRPTADRVREALFSSLVAAAGSLHGWSVLDLYAGSGAVGLEALSRGAARATFVESQRAAAEVIRANARASGLPGASIVVRRVSAFVEGSPPSEAPYDLVFADPPYDLPGEELRTVVAALTAPGWLAPGALVVVERATRGGVMEWPAGLRADRSRAYGEGTLWYAQANQPGAE